MSHNRRYATGEPSRWTKRRKVMRNASTIEVEAVTSEFNSVANDGGVVVDVSNHSMCNEAAHQCEAYCTTNF